MFKKERTEVEREREREIVRRSTLSMMLSILIPGSKEKLLFVFKKIFLSLFSTDCKFILKVVSSFLSLMYNGFVTVCNEVNGWKCEWLDGCLFHECKFELIKFILCCRENFEFENFKKKFM
jgi:hypothetical protein